MTKYATQKTKTYHEQTLENVNFSSSANVTVVGSLKDNVAVLISGEHIRDADSFDYSFSHERKGEIDVCLDLAFDIQYEQKRTGMIRRKMKESIHMDKTISAIKCSSFFPSKQSQKGLLEKASMTILILAASDDDEYGLLFERYKNTFKTIDAVISLRRLVNHHGSFPIPIGCKHSYRIMTSDVNDAHVAKTIIEKVEAIVEERIDKLIETFVETRKQAFISSKEVDAVNEIHNDADDYFARGSGGFLCR